MHELICDTSVLLALHQISRLDVLQALSTAVTVPSAVEQELAAGRSLGHDVPDVANLNWMTVRTPKQSPGLPGVSRLGPGESEVLWLALETPGSAAILDDHAARQLAAQLGVPYTGTLGLLVDAKRLGVVTAVAPLLDELERHGFRMSSCIRHMILRAAGEAP